MPLASPSSLTSNTLATFLDHVPISTNNAEKWKPKQMGSNSGGDYRALSRALSAPLGTERWISHHLFLSTGTEAGGEKEIVAAICLHVPEMSMERFKWSFIARYEKNEYNEFHVNLLLPHWYFHLLQDSVSLTHFLYGQCPVFIRYCITCGISVK